MTPDGLAFGMVLLAFNPYTGDVWNDIPAVHQALETVGYAGHAPTAGLTDVDGGGAIASAVVQADMARGYTEDTVFITTGFQLGPVGTALHTYGTYLNTSSDGGILSTRGNAENIDIFNLGWFEPLLAGLFGAPALMEAGDEVRPYLAADPDRLLMYDATDGQDQNFDQTKTWGNTPLWYDDGTNQGYWGYEGPVAGYSYYGFEMDGIRGWMKLDFTTPGLAVSGVRLTEYYFDVPEPATMSLLALGASLALVRRKRR